MSLDDWLKVNGFEPGPHGVYEFDREDLGGLWDAAGLEAVREREFVHAESSRIYAKLAVLVRAGASDLRIGLAVKEAVLSREKL